ncbi:hypothetical protein AMECASPLE_016598 [Ameca splendens]|uniref:Uncharacterized protein n=1 Tax=Ameca splendens TaxID=208324 RepID=A0ABV0ZY08_9TELE
MRVPSPCLNSSDIESLSLSASKTSSVTNPSESRTRTRSSDPNPTATISTRTQRRASVRTEAAEVQPANIPEDAKLNPTERIIVAEPEGLSSYPPTVSNTFLPPTTTSFCVKFCPSFSKLGEAGGLWVTIPYGADTLQKCEHSHGYLSLQSKISAPHCW